MITLLDKVLHLHPDIQGVVYWHEPNPLAPSNDPYERLLWENKTIAKPTRAELDAVTEAKVLEEQAKREAKAFEEQLKLEIKSDPLKAAAYKVYKDANPTKTFKDFITEMLAFGATV